VAFRHSKFEGDVATLNEAGFGQAIAKCGEVLLQCLRVPAIENTDHRHLLRPRGQRPRSRRAAYERDEISPLHAYSQDQSKASYRLKRVL